MSKLLVDTNILIYSKDSSSVFHDFAERVIKSNTKLYTTSKNLSEYYAVVTKGSSPLLSPLEALKDISVNSLPSWRYCTLPLSVTRNYCSLQLSINLRD